MAGGTEGLRHRPSPPTSFPHPSRVGPRPQRVVVSLLIGFLERCSRELCLRWVPLQTRSLHEACRGRRFQFHAEKVSSAPPSLSLRKQRVSEQEVVSEEDTNFGIICTEKSPTETPWIKLIKKQLNMTVSWNQNQGMP